MSFLFDPDLIDEIGQRHIGKPSDGRVADVDADLKATYGHPVQPDPPLYIHSARGIMDPIKLFALTPRESIMICGSAIGPPA